MLKTKNSHMSLWVVAIVSILWSASSQAIQVQIDEFGADKNGSSVFGDQFSNNFTPSQETCCYGVVGSYPNGAESGGLLTLNSDWGNLIVNSVGSLRQNLLTRATDAQGLTQGSSLDIWGIFTEVMPIGPLVNGYGIFVDNRGFGGNRFAHVQVQYLPDVGPVIRFILQDFGNSTLTDLGEVPLVFPAGTDEVGLVLGYSGSGSDFTAGYAFGTAGIFDPVTTFSTAATMFDNASAVQTGFMAFTAVPEPGTLALLSLGLAGLASRRRRAS